MPRLIAVLLLILGSAGLAHPQGAEVGVTAGWSSFSNGKIGEFPSFGGPSSEAALANGPRIGARLAINSWAFLGHEFSYSWQGTELRIDGQDQGGMSIQNFYYNFVVHALPEGSGVRPFVTAGAGFSSFFPPGVSSLSGRGETKFGVNFGAGLKVRLSERFGIRFDVRDHVTKVPFDLVNRPGSLHNVEYSAGFSLLF